MTGNQSPAQIPNKLKYLMKDIGHWSKYYQVPFKMPSRFPMNNRPPTAAAFAAKKAGNIN
ncbi:MAG: DsbA family protein [Cyanobacteriota bacterium]|nr:DsbA family protein [Cyanobacteriota bacterium]